MLLYMQQRYYDPRVGRFWSVDPVTVDSVGGNFNRYWYGNDNPYSFVDPDGRQAKREGPSADCDAECNRRRQEERQRRRDSPFTGGSLRLPELPQSVVDGAAGFGDGVFSAITLGQGNLDELRQGMGIDGGVEEDSLAYGAAYMTGEFEGSGAFGGAVVGAAARYTGPLRQWIRFGPTYSKALGQRINFSMRWGASPAKGGRYINEIPSGALRELNQWLRGIKLPGSGWRTIDPGHLHFWK